MAIEITSGQVTETLDYNRFFVEFWSVGQAFSLADSDAPVYELTMKAYRYAVDSNGNRHKEKGVDDLIITVSDLYGRAVVEATAGDSSLANLMDDVTTFIAKILSENTGLTATAS